MVKPLPAPATLLLLLAALACGGGGGGGGGGGSAPPFGGGGSGGGGAAAAAPSVRIVSAPPAGGVYSAGNVIRIELRYPGGVTVDTSRGTPSLTLVVGNTRRRANYQSSRGGNTLIFEYEVQSSDNDANGITIPENALTGTLYDSNGNALGNVQAAAAFATQRVQNDTPPVLAVPTVMQNPASPHDSLQVRWTEPPTVTPPVLHYNVSYSAGAVNLNGAPVTSAQGTVRVDAPATSTTLTDLLPHTRYEVKVNAVNAVGIAQGAPAGSATTANRAPSFSEGVSATRSFAENTAGGVNIGAPIGAVDEDGDELSYRFEDSGSYAHFGIERRSGQLRTQSGVIYDFEEREMYSVDVVAEDEYGGSAEIAVTISLTDEFELPIQQEQPPVPEPTNPQPDPTSPSDMGPGDPGSSYTVSDEERMRRMFYENSPEYGVRYQREVRPNSEIFIPATDTHLARINAAAAYARGATGRGETILVIDTGINENHREFARECDRDIPETCKTTTETLYPESPYTPTGDALNHGTGVAGLAAANRDGGSGLNMHGVAFDARIHLGYLPLGVGDDTYRPTPIGGGDDPTSGDVRQADLIERVLRMAEKVGAEVINLSFGIQGVISGYDPQDIREFFPLTAAATAQAGTNAADRKIFVWAAGNPGSRMLPNGDPAPVDSPELWPGLPYVFTELQGHSLAVVALDQDGSIASYSAQCGIAKAFCLAAPGSDLVVPRGDNNDRYVATSGTSSAAPLVTGALAVMGQHFRGQLGNTELVARVLTTANKNGIYADADIYGQGLLDLDTATRPIGQVSMAMGAHVGGPALPFDGAALGSLGPAAGDAIARALAGREFAVLDELGAPFFLDAGVLARGAAAQPGESGAGGDLLRTVRQSARSFELAWQGFGGGALSFSLAERRTARSPGEVEELLVRFGGRGRGGVRSATGDGYGHGLAGGIGAPGDGLGLAGGGVAASGGDPAGGLGAASGSSSAASGSFFLLHGHPGRLFGLYSIDEGLARNFEAEPFHAAPYLSFIGSGVGLGGVTTLAGFGPASAGPLAGMRLAYGVFQGRPRFAGFAETEGAENLGAVMEFSLLARRGAGALSFQVGALEEAEGFMGASPRGALGRARSRTLFGGLAAQLPLGRRAQGEPAAWRLRLSAYAGRTTPELRGARISEAPEVLLTSSFGASLSRRALLAKGDRLVFSLSQPLRIESGGLSLRMPIGRTRTRDVLYRALPVNLEPSGRSLEWLLSYGATLGRARLHAALGLTRHPGHSRFAETERRAWLLLDMPLHW